MIRTVLAITAIATIANVAHAQSPFPTTDSQARLSQRSTIDGDYNTDARTDIIRQSANATIAGPGALNPYAQAFLEERYGSGPMFTYDQSFVTQFGFGFGTDNALAMTYGGVDRSSQDGGGGIDRKLIISEQIAVQRGSGNTTRLAGDIRQTGRPVGPGVHGDILDLKLDVATQVGVQVGNGNRLSLDLRTEQSDD